MEALEGIKFGFADAEVEMESAPELLIDGYYDVGGALTKVRDSNVFLVLGRKGTGKTALWAKLELEARDRYSLFTTLCKLRDFPFRQFGGVGDHRETGLRRHTPAWKWLLYLKCFESLLRDASLEFDSTLQVLQTELKGAELIPGRSLMDITRTIAKKNFRISLPYDAGGGGGEHAVEKSIKQAEDLADYMARKLDTVRPINNRHLIFVDGLDDIYTTDERDLQILLGLLRASDDINKRFASAGASVKVVLLFRPDVFTNLPDPNTNKILQDSATRLDWYPDVREISNSGLVKMVEQRVGIHRPDLAADFLGTCCRKKYRDTRLLGFC